MLSSLTPRYYDKYIHNADLNIPTASNPIPRAKSRSEAVLKKIVILLASCLILTGCGGGGSSSDGSSSTDSTKASLTTLAWDFELPTQSYGNTFLSKASLWADATLLDPDGITTNTGASPVPMEKILNRGLSNYTHIPANASSSDATTFVPTPFNRAIIPTSLIVYAYTSPLSGLHGVWPDIFKNGTIIEEVHYRYESSGSLLSGQGSWTDTLLSDGNGWGFRAISDISGVTLPLTIDVTAGSHSRVEFSPTIIAANMDPNVPLGNYIRVSDILIKLKDGEISTYYRIPVEDYDGYMFTAPWRILPIVASLPTDTFDYGNSALIDAENSTIVQKDQGGRTILKFSLALKDNTDDIQNLTISGQYHDSNQVARAFLKEGNAVKVEDVLYGEPLVEASATGDNRTLVFYVSVPDTDIQSVYLNEVRINYSNSDSESTLFDAFASFDVAQEAFEDPDRYAYSYLVDSLSDLASSPSPSTEINTGTLPKAVTTLPWDFTQPSDVYGNTFVSPKAAWDTATDLGTFSKREIIGSGTLNYSVISAGVNPYSDSNFQTTSFARLILPATVIVFANTNPASGLQGSLPDTFAPGTIIEELHYRFETSSSLITGQGWDDSAMLLRDGKGWGVRENGSLPHTIGSGTSRVDAEATLFVANMDPDVALGNCIRLSELLVKLKNGDQSNYYRIGLEEYDGYTSSQAYRVCPDSTTIPTDQTQPTTVSLLDSANSTVKKKSQDGRTILKFNLTLNAHAEDIQNISISGRYLDSNQTPFPFLKKGNAILIQDVFYQLPLVYASDTGAYRVLEFYVSVPTTDIQSIILNEVRINCSSDSAEGTLFDPIVKLTVTEESFNDFSRFDYNYIQDSL